VSDLRDLLARRRAVILDGGLASELERRGHDLDDALWSARLLRDAPEEIRRVHGAYLEAGADCIVSASYQASLEGFIDSGMSRRRAADLIRSSVTLAEEARDEYLQAQSKPAAEKPVVAASIGPYGAYLADGSEYLGRYEIDVAALRSFHQPRWEILSECCRLMACETIPSQAEARVLLDLLRQSPGVLAWISFSCRDGAHISDGTPLAQCAALCAESEQVVAVGINCTPPSLISSLIGEARLGAPAKPIVVYPNSGETYVGAGRRWTGGADRPALPELALEWYRRGARLIGGCCRTGPEDIRALRLALDAGVEQPDLSRPG
jgi:homocysteine S-methyltransferase